VAIFSLLLILQPDRAETVTNIHILQSHLTVNVYYTLVMNQTGSLISMAQEFFEIHWITGKEDPYFQTDAELKNNRSFQKLEDYQASII
jgi:hypothetical protein